MKTEKRLYRSRGSLAGGVCAGVADYFGLDAIVARILAVILLCATGGLMIVAYVTLWAVLPKVPDGADAYEVTPQSAYSEMYGDMDCKPACRAADDDDWAAVYLSSRGAYRGVGHMPPAPPVGACVPDPSSSQECHRGNFE